MYIKKHWILIVIPDWMENVLYFVVLRLQADACPGSILFAIVSGIGDSICHCPEAITTC